MAFLAAFLADAESAAVTAGVAACSVCATGAAGIAGACACAVEVNGKANVAADKREMRSLFMGSNVLKINKDIVSPESGINLTRQIHRQARERDAVRP